MPKPKPPIDDLFAEPAPKPAPVPEQPVREVYTPSRLNREARMLLERGLPALWVEGEISNLSRPSSGHWYFSLKDEAAQLRCAMFRQRNLLARFTPKDGMHVQARGRVTLYEARGDFQFIIDYIEEAGEGALRRRFELLKAKLAAEGLFAAERKRALPKLPRRIGVITSPTGAAIRDVLHILKRRFCSIPVLIYPVQVQGAAAAPQIARAIRLASARAECDVLILARGGGSLEDLWAFNEEIVARAICECQIPIVSGVGHEVDFTIADFVADVRAPTPSGAAELVAPDCAEWLRGLSILSRRLTNALGRTVAKRSERFKWLTRRLAQRHPGLELRQRTLRLDELERRLVRATRHHIAVRANELRGAVAHLRQHSPALRVASAKARLAAASRSLETLTRQRLEQRNRKLLSLIAHLRQQSPAARVSTAKGQLAVASRSLESAARLQLERLNRRVATAGGLLDAFSPLKTLQRGYAIVTDQHGHVITASTEVPIGASIRARLARGEIQARVESTRPPDNADSTKDDGPKEP